MTTRKSKGILKLENHLQKLTELNTVLKLQTSRPSSVVIRNLSQMNANASYRALNIATELYQSGAITKYELKQLRERIFRTKFQNDEKLFGWRNLGLARRILSR